MNVNKYLKKQAVGYSVMLIVGLSALFIGYILKLETHAMSGIAIGFIPVGIGGLVMMLYSKNNPAMYRNIEIEADERNMFIRDRTGATAFWITFWYISALTVLSHVVKLSQDQYGFFTLIFMTAVYFLMLFINISKY